MDIMDGMDTMDFPFDGRMDRFRDVALLYVSILSIASRERANINHNRDGCATF
jgi:hypothetical protein